MNLPLPANSRFFQTDLIESGDGSHEWGLWKPSPPGSAREVMYVVTPPDIGRPDRIAAIVYGDSLASLWWHILYYNGVHDAFSLQPGDRLIIPDAPAIPERVARASSAATDQPKNVPRVPFRKIPSFLEVIGLEEVSGEVPEAPLETSPEFSAAVLSVVVPKCQSGRVHFDYQVSRDSSFSTLDFNGSTKASPGSWRFWNQFLENGGYEGFPEAGLDVSVHAGTSVFTETQLVKGATYFRRFRMILDGIPRAWYGTPPSVLAP